MFQNNKNGFTLIELIIVIVILGILAVVAAPKFIDFRSEAIIASSTSLKGVIETTSSLIYSKSVIEGVEKLASAEITISGEKIEVVYGYPAANQNGISAAINFDEGDWANGVRDKEWHSRESTYSGAWVYWHGSINEDAGNVQQCYLRYRQSVAQNTKPVIDSVLTNC
ncbi:prepilin-type N-terminal cleavage/methylation domain-containing protein [Paraglaciecola sp. L3A3]|uniref:prepilin-type N-terminal cleavage/methylation domain-containing protein n=1 Tax=Paraglaciecola sp. L3A3 TaxID=2686358 RepID=UPI00131C5C1C|nr:prepilin-type N-terminal cleavage/methylation domain-containing protein [Paraglaciecola sp. L3A3]